MTDLGTQLVDLGNGGGEKETLHQKRMRKASHLSDIVFHPDENPTNVIWILTRVTLICMSFMAVELIGGLLSDSVAVISDALHLGIDVIGYLIQIYSAWLATKAANKTYSFGYQRAEPIGALLNCLSIWALTVYLLYEAIRRLYHPSNNFDPRFMLFTSAFGVFANLMMGVVVGGCSVLKYMIIYPCLSAKDKDNITVSTGTENLNVRAVMAHVLGDLVYSMGVLIAAIVINIKPEWQFIDSICTILFSFVVLHITIPVCRDSMSCIMEAVPAGIDKDAIIEQIGNVKDVVELKSLRIWSITQESEEDADEQNVQNRIGRILKESDVSYWAIQSWKGTQNVCFQDDEL